MGKPQGRKKNRTKHKEHRRNMKAKNITRHYDQIYQDLKPENAKRLLNQDLNEELPGLGQYYCIECASYYVNKRSLTEHQKTKLHKRKKKILKVKPYDHKEAEFLNKY